MEIRSKSSDLLFFNVEKALEVLSGIKQLPFDEIYTIDSVDMKLQSADVVVIALQSGLLKGAVLDVTEPEPLREYY